MKYFFVFLTAGALVFGGGCKKKTPVAANPPVTNQVEQAAPVVPQPQTAAARQSNPVPAAPAAPGSPKKIPMVP